MADFRRLYDFGEAGRADLTVAEAKFNRAMRIDTSLVNPLKTLPGFPAGERNLAFRNLTRAKMVTLATGQQMATFLKGKGVTLTKLTAAQVRAGSTGASMDVLTLSRPPAALGDPFSPPPPTSPLLLIGGRQRASIVRDPPGIRRSDPTTRRSGWSTCCCSPSRARRRSSLRSGNGPTGDPRPLDSRIDGPPAVGSTWTTQQIVERSTSLHTKSTSSGRPSLAARRARPSANA